jgi:hypothetical protein
MTRATRDMILAGAAPAPYAVPALGGAEVLLRPLTAVEASEIRTLQVEGLKLAGPALTGMLGGAGDVADVVGRARRRAEEPVKESGEDGITVDLAALIAANGRAQVLAAAYGLVEPALTRAELEASPNPAVVEQIGAEVMRRSGLGRRQAGEIAGFREDARGSDDPAPAPLGSATGPDAG